MSERYVDVTELAEIMGVSRSTIYRFIAAGMPSETWGMRRTRRYLPSACLRWARARDASIGDHNRRNITAVNARS
jgi:excisionase family DNA binding protein